jgi:hypothetical protein
MTNRRVFMTGVAAAGMTLATPAILYAHGRGEFAEFVEKRTPVLPLNATRLALCNAAEEAINQGDGKHHVFFAPRNIGKTIIFSHALPAWYSFKGYKSIAVARSMDMAVHNRRSMMRQAVGDYYDWNTFGEHIARRCHFTAPGSALSSHRGDLIVIDADEVLNSGRQRLWQESLLLRLSPNGTLITVTSHGTNLTGIDPRSTTTLKEFV